jgi:hypothetical protein
MIRVGPQRHRKKIHIKFNNIIEILTNYLTWTLKHVLVLRVRLSAHHNLFLCFSFTKYLTGFLITLVLSK